MNTALDFIQNELLKFFIKEEWFLTKANDSSKFNEHDIFLVIHSSTEKNLQEINASILEHIKSNRIVINFSIETPINAEINSSLPLSLFQVILKLQTQITRSLNTYLKSGTNPDSLSLQTKPLTILAIFLKNLNHNVKAELLEYLFRAWLSDSLDNRAELSYIRLSGNKAVMLDSFKNTYIKQKESILHLIDNALRHSEVETTPTDFINNSKYYLKQVIDQIYTIISSNKDNDYSQSSLRYYQITIEKIFDCLGVSRQNRLYYPYLCSQYFKEKVQSS